MKRLLLLTTATALIAIACNNPIEVKPTLAMKGCKSTLGIPPDEYNNTKGYWENGTLITEFDCPDAVRFFPPIDIKQWDKVDVVNGRLPTYHETKNGSSIHHYGEKETAVLKHYNMTLPKLAYCLNNPGSGHFVFDKKTGKLTNQRQPVVVIQIVQTNTDTVVGYRYLSGGCGGSVFRNFHFLTPDEVDEVMRR